MKKHNIKDFIKGWVVGDFVDSIIRTKNFEVACKSYKAGQVEGKHVHKITTEITIITFGVVKINDEIFHTGAVIVVEPGDIIQFESITNSNTTVIKVPSVIGDKYEVHSS